MVKRIAANPRLLLGLFIVLAFSIVAAAAPSIAPPRGEDPYVIPASGYATPPEPPRRDHPLGTMQSGYDVFYGLVWGTRIAFRVGLLVTLGRAIIGVLLGLASGYYGGWLDALMMRFTDAFMAFPVVAAVLLMLSVTTDAMQMLLGQADRAIAIGLIAFGWMQYARLVRANVLVERNQEYVLAARSVGATDRRIVFRHLLPNSARGLLVLVASDIGAMVVTVAALTFIGLSGDQPRADWGSILQYTRNWIIGGVSNAFQYWYTYVPPSLAIVLFSVGWNLIGDGLRDVLDPRMRGVRG